jgi:hypothetical protein
MHQITRESQKCATCIRCVRFNEYSCSARTEAFETLMDHVALPATIILGGSFLFCKTMKLSLVQIKGELHTTAGQKVFLQKVNIHRIEKFRQIKNMLQQSN